jgi:uncharacterized RDD family membrane protein YckC
MEQKESTLQKPMFKQVFGAYLIDALFLWVLGALATVLGIVVCRINSTLLSNEGWLIVWNAFPPIISLVYFMITEGETGSSVGKRKFHLRTLRVKTDKPVSRLRIFAAYFIDIALVCCICFPLYFAICCILLFILSGNPLVTGNPLVGITLLLNVIAGGYLLCGIPLLIGYFSIMECGFGSTLGKAIASITVYQE